VLNWRNLFCFFSPLFCPSGQLGSQPTLAHSDFFTQSRPTMALKNRKELNFPSRNQEQVYFEFVRLTINNVRFKHFFIAFVGIYTKFALL